MSDPNTKKRGWRPSRGLIWFLSAPVVGCVALAYIWPLLGVPVRSGAAAGLGFAALFAATLLWRASAFGVVVLGLAAWRRAWVTVAVLAACALVGLGPVLWSFVRPLPAAPRGEPALTVMTANLLVGRGDIEALLDEAAQADADVIVIQEVAPRDRTLLRVHGGERWPHQVVESDPGAFGQATLSRLPFASVRAKPDSGPVPRDGWPPQIGVRVLWEGMEIDVVNVHVYPPVPRKRYLIGQDEQAVGLAAHCRTLDGDAVIAAGDFNSPEIGRPVRLFTHGERRMRTAWGDAGRGLGITWGRGTLKGLLLASRIDHVLYRGELACVEAGVGGEIGSDHRAVWARFVRVSSR